MQKKWRFSVFVPSVLYYVDFFASRCCLLTAEERASDTPDVGPKMESNPLAHPLEIEAPAKSSTIPELYLDTYILTGILF
jgi:hypothetical protein